jgi:hypothetical protein
MNAAPIRASDAEREDVTRLLQRAVAEGRLTPEEAGERLATASAARYREDLGRLVEDLPESPEPVLPDRRGAIWFGVAARVTRGLVFAALALAFFSFWGVRMFFPFWIFGLMALGIAARVGRRYRRRAVRWHAWRWGGAAEPRWLGPSGRPW